MGDNNKTTHKPEQMRVISIVQAVVLLGALVASDDSVVPLPEDSVMPEFMQLKWENPWAGKTKPCCLTIDGEEGYRKHGSYTTCMVDAHYGSLPEFQAWCKQEKENCLKDMLGGECKTAPCWKEQQNRPCTDQMVTEHRRCGGEDGKQISSLINPSEDKLAKGYQSPAPPEAETPSPPPPPERYEPYRGRSVSTYDPYNSGYGHGGSYWLEQTKEKVNTQKISQGWIGNMVKINQYYTGPWTGEGAGCSGCSNKIATRYSTTERFKNNCGCSDEDLECQSICNRRYARCGQQAGYVDPRTGVNGFTGQGNGE